MLGGILRAIDDPLEGWAGLHLVWRLSGGEKHRVCIGWCRSVEGKRTLRVFYSMRQSESIDL